MTEDTRSPSRGYSCDGSSGRCTSAQALYSGQTRRSIVMCLGGVSAGGRVYSLEWVFGKK